MAGSELNPGISLFDGGLLEKVLIGRSEMVDGRIGDALNRS